MEHIWQRYKLPIIALVVLIIVALSSIIVVPETEQAVIIRTGEPVAVINKFDPRQPYGETGAGIWYRIPGLERVQMVDRRILNLSMSRQQVLSKDQQRLQVDAYARFRVVDPVRMVRTAGTVAQLRQQLLPILTSVLRQELGRRPFAALIDAERGPAMKNITKMFNAQAQQYGAEVLDVRIKSADLPAGRPLDAAFTRMETDRQEEAATIRAKGARDAQIIRSRAKAEAASIYAKAYGKDPKFYDFYRAMQSYRRTFESGNGTSNIIMGPDNEYLKQFQGQP